MADNKMNFEDFCDYISAHIKEYMPDEFQDLEPRLVDSAKLNSDNMTGIALHKPGTVRAVPVLRLDSVYADYSRYQNYDINCALQYLSESYVSALNSDDYKILPEYIDTFTHLADENAWDNVKDHVMIHAVSVSGNESILQELPHTIQGDIAGIYKFSINMGEKERFHITINNTMADAMGVGLDELHQTAVNNGVRCAPAEYMGLQNMMEDMFPEIPTESLFDDDTQIPLNVLTNQQKCDGAAVIFYPGMMEMIAKQFPQGFYVLPSSCHEVMICPKDSCLKVEELNEMVQQINKEMVPPEERLSDFVHEYDPVTKQLHIASDCEELVESQEHKTPVR